MILHDRYEIIKLIGKGGFCETFLAEDRFNPNSLCVIKKLDPNTADVETAKRLFQREAEVLRDLVENDKIPKFLDFFEENGSYYLIEEHINGTTLNHLMGSTWMEQEVIRLVKEVCEILEPLHRQNIIHRDIKPTNLIRNFKDNTFVLIDFGAVKRIESQNFAAQRPDSATQIGTYGYSPIEQLRGYPRLNSDIYALGITAIELLTKIPSPSMERDRDDNIIYPPNIHVSPEFARVLNKMVRNDPLERYQSLKEVVQVLERLKGYPTQKQNTLPKPSVRDSRGFKLWWIPAGLGGLLALLTLAEFTFYPLVRPWYHLSQGDRLFKNYSPELALKEYQQAESLRPNSFDVWLGIGNSLAQTDRPEAAISAYNKALSFKANDIRALNKKALALYRSGQPQEALTVSNQVLELDSKNTDALQNKALALYGLGQNSESLAVLQQVKDLQPDNPETWLTESLVYSSDQNVDKAKNANKEALELYDSNLQKNPKDPILWNGKAQLLLNTRQSEEALKAYDRALIYAPNFYSSVLGKANSLIQLAENNYNSDKTKEGDLYSEQALQHYDKAIQIREKGSEALLGKGQALYFLEKYEEALTYLRRARDNSNRNSRELLVTAWVREAEVLASLQRNNEYMNALGEAKKIDRKNPKIWETEANILLTEGKPREALESYNRAIAEGLTVFKPARDELQQKLRQPS